MDRYTVLCTELRGSALSLNGNVETLQQKASKIQKAINKATRGDHKASDLTAAYTAQTALNQSITRLGEICSAMEGAAGKFAESAAELSGRANLTAYYMQHTDTLSFDELMGNYTSAIVSTGSAVAGYEVVKGALSDSGYSVDSLGSVSNAVQDAIQKEAEAQKAKSYAAAAVLGLVSPVAALLYVSSGVAFGNTPSFFDETRTPSSGADADWLGYEFSDDNPGVTAWVGKANAEAQNEWGYAGVNAYLGKAEAELDADFAFMETKKKKEFVDGKWVEKTVTKLISVEAGASAAVSVISADAEAGVGSDMLGGGVAAGGSVGNAKAGAEGNFSITEDGVNLNVKGEALVSAAEGEVSGTINILGIEITGKVGGYAGAVGVKGKFGIEDNKFVMEGGVAALLGISGGVEIGFNDTGWDNVVDFVTFWD